MSIRIVILLATNTIIAAKECIINATIIATNAIIAAKKSIINVTIIAMNANIVVNRNRICASIIAVNAISVVETISIAVGSSCRTNKYQHLFDNFYAIKIVVVNGAEAHLLVSFFLFHSKSLWQRWDKEF